MTKKKEVVLKGFCIRVGICKIFQTLNSPTHKSTFKTASSFLLFV